MGGSVNSGNYKGVRSTDGNRLFNQCINQCHVKGLNIDNVTCETTSVSPVNSDRGNKEMKSNVLCVILVY